MLLASFSAFCAPFLILFLAYLISGIVRFTRLLHRLVSNHVSPVREIVCES
ncbi:hypothetical protein Pan189_03540 [Stratiformator vulcanicus]|uniref:Uncharacterized protein n=1 Tax=Stratiformator vulcanicus TaxID=2527980 RepID=A0A517QWF9_9PLAN|nr:hypothetical protein Pan189_03540 [Stratiformator vulcanicus]